MRIFSMGGVDSGRWRGVFLVYGAVGLVWAFLFWRWFRDEPRLHRGVNALEQALIEGENPPSTDDSAFGRGSPFSLVRSRDLQFLALANFAVNLGWIFVGTLLPTYLIAARGHGEIEAGVAAGMTATAGMAGCLCGGIATDWLVKRVGIVWGRRLPGMLSYGGAAIFYATCFAVSDTGAVVPLLIAASFFGDFALGAMWATYQDIGQAWAGTVLGWANMCGNIGAACSASFVPRLAEYAGWPSVFIFSCITYTIGSLAWLGVDPRRKIGDVAGRELVRNTERPSHN
jgi:ACS family glucarate transporter-like MFS transporter